MYTLCYVLPCSVSVSSIVELLGESHHHLLDVWHCCRLFCISAWSPVVLLQFTVWDCSVQNFIGTGIFQNFSMGVLMVYNIWAFPWKLVEPTYFVVVAMVIPHVVSRCENGLFGMAMVVIAFPDLRFLCWPWRFLWLMILLSFHLWIAEWIVSSICVMVFSLGWNWLPMLKKWSALHRAGCVHAFRWTSMPANHTADSVEYILWISVWQCCMPIIHLAGHAFNCCALVAVSSKGNFFVWLVYSASPLAWGWHAVVRHCFVPISQWRFTRHSIDKLPPMGNKEWIQVCSQ